MPRWLLEFLCANDPIVHHQIDIDVKPGFIERPAGLFRSTPKVNYSKSAGSSPEM